MALHRFTPDRLTWRETDDGHLHVEGALGTLAIVFGESRTPNGGQTGVSGDEGQHNARLFAAAPELLAGCEAALELIPERPDRAEAAVATVLRAAIAKAVAR